MKLILEKGCPAGTEGHLEKELRVYDLLDSLGMEYYRIDHAPAMTMEACCKIDEALEAVICKNLFLCNRQKPRFYLLMIPGDKVFHTRDVFGPYLEAVRHDMKVVCLGKGDQI